MWRDAVSPMENLIDCREFPAVCPICGEKGAHLYLRAWSAREGLWIWCSFCRTLEHPAILPPSGWIDDCLIDPQRLSAVPDCLEMQKEAIDSFITANYRGLAGFYESDK